MLAHILLSCSLSRCDHCISALMAFYTLKTASTPSPFSSSHIPFQLNTQWCCPSVFGRWNPLVWPSLPASMQIPRRPRGIMGNNVGKSAGWTQTIRWITLDCEKCERSRCILQAEQPLLECPWANHPLREMRHREWWNEGDSLVLLCAGKLSLVPGD